jgi:ABC-2 type transport system permease protein
MNTHVLKAVFRRNFISYFANPTGYVFICLFVFFGAIAAFWVPDFFGNNLANLDQLSFWFPFLMLVYIPTITMGIWADERKQGTDELLLTIPARDFDIVMGKYLAAVAIFSVSLLFSLVCNYMVLNNLASAEPGLTLAPQLDAGLFMGTYIGYWLVGVAMLAIGVIASFLTSNITIGFVLGVLFNMPLVFLASADSVFGGIGQRAVLAIKGWSIGQQFADFGRGVLTLSGMAYFFAIGIVMLYISMILIGRRHWFTGEARWQHALHYAVRSLALVVIAFGVVVMFQDHDIRLDASSAQLSSVSYQTRQLIRDLKVTRPVQIDAFISPTVPESYVQTRLNLLAMLRELQALGGERVQVNIYNTDRYSQEAALAEKRYGIEPRQVQTLDHGKFSVDQIFLYVAVSGGAQKEVPPVFIDRGVPVEYELIRSVCTVCEQKRKTVGILKTDAPLYGGFSMQTMSPTPNWPIIDELEKQYNVEKVDPAKPITEKYDVLLAVQPSSLGPAEMGHFIAAIENGQPTAIFEDPAPVFSSAVPATSMPRQPPGGMNPMFGGQAPPKGDINKLWKVLGVDFDSTQIVWQAYNPYPKASHFPPEFVFVDPSSGAEEAFNPNDPISSGLQQLLYPFPGAVAKLNTSKLNFTPLTVTSDKTGTVRFGDLMQMSPFGQRGGLNPNRRWLPTHVAYALSAHIEGKEKVPSTAEKEGEKGEKSVNGEKGEKEAKINVVIVADIDMLSQDFFKLREQGNMPEIGMNFAFDNVPFVLNVLDELAGDQRFIEIRKRRPIHRTLSRIEERTKEAKDKAAVEREQFNTDFDAEEQKQQDAIVEKITEMKKRKNVDPQQMLIEVAMMQQDLERQKEAKIEQKRQEKDRKINEIETDLALKVRGVQFEYKMWAILLPPIPPLILAVLVFLHRRRREREGVAQSRLR